MKCKTLFVSVLAGVMLCSAGISVNAASSADMEISQNGIDFICGCEGFSAKCYWDSSQSSIGYGTKCRHSSVQPHTTGLHSITREQAMEDMHSEINTNYIKKVRNQTQGLDLNQNQFDALISLAYNCGGGLNRIYNAPLTKYLRGELSASEARSQYSNYIVYSGGKYLKGLYNRRVKEANLFFTEPTLQKPANAVLSLAGDRTVFDVSENLEFQFHADDAEAYYLNIELVGKSIDTLKIENSETYEKTFDQPGHYRIYASAYNTYGTAESEAVEFDVVLPEEAPHWCEVSTQNDRTIFHTDEKIQFTMSSDNASYFVLHIMRDTAWLGDVPVTKKNDVYSCPTSFGTPGTYTFYASAYYGDYSADSQKITVQITDSSLPGDLNFDQSVDTADLILMQNYLQQKNSLTKAQSAAADMNQDNICNIYDFIALKQKLLSE